MADWTLPPLDTQRTNVPEVSEHDRIRANLVVEALCALKAPCKLHRIVVGPQVTRIEVEPEPFTLMRVFQRTTHDLAYALSAERVRIIAPIPGKKLVGIELPALDRRTVRLGELSEAHGDLVFPLGIDPDGNEVMLPLAQAPHLLIAGQTGAGKSTALNSLLCSLLHAYTPDDLRLIMIDTKRVELAPYDGLPHLTESFENPFSDTVDQAIDTLQELVWLMEKRYEIMAEIGVKNFTEARAKLGAAAYYVCVIDELADLMMASGKTVESFLVRLAQKGRAAGIHLVIATQSPRVQVITGLLKVNLPSRIAFSVPTMTDSRVVLDRNGAEALLGKGDGLLSFGGSEPVRFQGAMVTEEEIDSLCSAWREQKGLVTA